MSSTVYQTQANIVREKVLAEASKQGMTLTGLARSADLSSSRLRMWKQRGGELGHMSMARVLHALGKTPNWAYEDIYPEIKTGYPSIKPDLNKLLDDAIETAKRSKNS